MPHNTPHENHGRKAFLMRLLFIGGTGNLSTDCAALLHQRGHEISVVTRGKSAVPPEYQTVRADRTSPEEMRAALKDAKPDVVLNFLGFDIPDVRLDHELFNGAVRQYIYISSASVYAKPHRQLPVPETAPVGNKWSEYAQKKLACERWLLDRRAESRFPVTIVRPSHTYSKLWVPNPVSSASYTFARRIEKGQPVFVPGDGENLWTLTATSDFAAGLAGLTGCAAAVGETYNITSDEALTWNRICAEIAEALGVKEPNIAKAPLDLICRAAPELTATLKGDKANAGVFDNSKIKRAVPGFVCRKPFRVGIRESVKWLREHPAAQNLNPRVDATIDKVLEEITFQEHARS
jgi:nucleoside-diphosphate-sugar epimerase